MLVSNPLIKFQKVYQKGYQQKRKYALFPLLLMFVKLVLLITFFDALKKRFFNRFESA
jgi:hypothetical protein